MNNNYYLKPNFNDGRIFISPILGCNGCCKYCYLEMHEYNVAHENLATFNDVNKFISNCESFVPGRNGTILSIGAWGDIFPTNELLKSKSINFICKILSIGNPVQIMSKFTIDDSYIKKICNSQVYKNQLLYSTTITTINNWKVIEPNTADPINRLKTCKKFSSYGVHTNVLLKPFIYGITDIEFDIITDLLLKYSIDYCVLGIFYWDKNIEKKMNSISIQGLKHIFDNNTCFEHLDCNGNIKLKSTNISLLKEYVKNMRKKGIQAFLKSSCVNSNLLKMNNPSNYYKTNSKYCFQCGNCQ